MNYCLELVINKFNSGPKVIMKYIDDILMTIKKLEIENLIG